MRLALIGAALALASCTPAPDRSARCAEWLSCDDVLAARYEVGDRFCLAARHAYWCADEVRLCGDLVMLDADAGLLLSAYVGPEICRALGLPTDDGQSGIEEIPEDGLCDLGVRACFVVTRTERQVAGQSERRSFVRLDTPHDRYPPVLDPCISVSDVVADLDYRDHAGALVHARPCEGRRRCEYAE